MVQGRKEIVLFAVQDREERIEISLKRKKNCVSTTGSENSQRV